MSGGRMFEDEEEGREEDIDELEEEFYIENEDNVINKFPLYSIYNVRGNLHFKLEEEQRMKLMLKAREEHIPPYKILKMAIDLFLKEEKRFMELIDENIKNKSRTKKFFRVREKQKSNGQEKISELEMTQEWIDKLYDFWEENEEG